MVRCTAHTDRDSGGEAQVLRPVAGCSEGVIAVDILWSSSSTLQRSDPLALLAMPRTTAGPRCCTLGMPWLLSAGQWFGGFASNTKSPESDVAIMQPHRRREKKKKKKAALFLPFFLLFGRGGGKQAANNCRNN